jgi:hypothetical protein
LYCVLTKNGEPSHLLIYLIVVYLTTSDLCTIKLYLSVCVSTALADLGHFFSFLILYTVDKTLWKGDQPVARPLPAYRHACLGWDSNWRSQCSSERRQFMPQTARPL